MGDRGKGLKRSPPQQDEGEEESSITCSPSPLLASPSILSKKPRLEDVCGVSPKHTEPDPDQGNGRIDGADPDEGNRVCEDDDEKEDDYQSNSEKKDNGDGKAHDSCSKSVDITRLPRGGSRQKSAMIGPRFFESSKAMLDYFYFLLNGWPLLLDINKYEHLMLEDLIKRGHKEAKQKIGVGIKAFQVRLNQDFEPHCRCFYIIRKDGSIEDFSYRKCVDNILPLPSNLKAKASGRNNHPKEKHKDKQKLGGYSDDRRHGKGHSRGQGRSRNSGRAGNQSRGKGGGGGHRY